MYGLGYLYYLSERWADSEEYLYKAIEVNSKNSLALNNLGALYARNKKYFQAEDLIKKAIGLRPSELFFYTNLFGVYTQSEDSDKFEREFAERVKSGATIIARGYGITLARKKRQAGFRLYSQGKLNDAIHQFNAMLKIFSAINRDSGVVATLFSLGVLYEEQGNLIKAKESFRNVLKINPNHLQAHDRINALNNDKK